MGVLTPYPPLVYTPLPRYYTNSKVYTKEVKGSTSLFFHYYLLDTGIRING